tara:strand:+ start:571 stop:1359 length:789 start_codon:yes stop_codon:yes gene_type:complete
MYCVSIDLNNVNQLSDYTLSSGIQLDFSQDCQKAFVRIGSQRVYVCRELFSSYIRPYINSFSKYSGLYGLANHSSNLLAKEDKPLNFKNYSLLKEHPLKVFYAGMQITATGCPYVKKENASSPDLLVKSAVPFSKDKRYYIIPKGNSSIIKHHKVKEINKEYTNLYDITSLEYLFKLSVLDPLYLVVSDKKDNTNIGVKFEMLWDASHLTIKVSKVNLKNYAILKSLHVKRIKIEDSLKVSSEETTIILKSISDLHAKYIFG